jgi:hypothetical protein
VSSSLQHYDLFIDPNDSVEVLRFQIYSLTDVAPEVQLIVGLNPKQGDYVLQDDCNLAALGIESVRHSI